MGRRMRWSNLAAHLGSIILDQRLNGKQRQAVMCDICAGVAVAAFHCVDDLRDGLRLELLDLV